MNTNDWDTGIMKHYEFDKSLFIPGDVYMLHYPYLSKFAIFEEFDDSNAAIFVGLHMHEYVRVETILNGDIHIEKVISKDEFMRTNGDRSRRLWGLKEVYKLDPNVFQIGAVYLIRNLDYAYDESYLGILRNVVLNPTGESPYIEFMCAVSDHMVRFNIDEIGETHTIELVDTVKSYLKRKDTE